MDIQRLASFARVCEYANITKAAAALGVMPSVVSRHISALEEEAGGQLFLRTGRGVVLTELGKRVLPRVTRTLAEYQELLASFHSRDDAVSGEVRLGVVPSLAHIVAPRLFKDLQAACPGIRLQVLEGATEQLDAWRSDNLVDITLLFRPGGASLVGEDQLAEVDTYLIGPTGDRLTAGELLPFSRMAGIPLVLAPLPNPLRRDVSELARAQGIVLNVVLETNSLAVQAQLASQGLAYTIVAGHAVMQLAGGRLQAARIVEPGVLRTIAIGISAHRPADAAKRLVAREIRRIVEQSFAAMPG